MVKSVSATEKAIVDMGKKARLKSLPAADVKTLALSEIAPWEENPRAISDEALAGLTSSMERFGCVEPIVVNVRCGANRIVGGHQRYKVLRAAGAVECVCVTVDLGEAEEKLLNLTLNNPAIQGEFIEAIDAHIESLRLEMPEDLDLLLDLQIDAIAPEVFEPAEKAGEIPDDQIPPPVKETITKPGDLWMLGDHRLLCGSSTNSDDVMRLMDGQKAQLMATDPPYCVDYTGADRPNGGKDWSEHYHETEIKDAANFFLDFISTALLVCQHNVAFYIWHATKRFSLLEASCRATGLLPHQVIIWVKPCTVMGFSFYHYRHEPCLLCWPKGHKPPLDRKQSLKTSTVWTAGFEREGDPTTPAYYSDVWELDWDGKKRSPSAIEHPTVKPVEVFAIPMRVHTQPGDLCYEPFSGSGSQIIAAEKTGRRCFAMELEPFFCDVAVKRWEAWTGLTAERMKAKG